MEAMEAPDAPPLRHRIEKLEAELEKATSNQLERDRLAVCRCRCFLLEKRDNVGYKVVKSWIDRPDADSCSRLKRWVASGIVERAGQPPILFRMAPHEIVTDVGETLLHASARVGHPETVKLLLGMDHFDANMRDMWGRTPLHLGAISPAAIAVIDVLLQHGADPDAVDAAGMAVGDYLAVVPVHHVAAEETRIKYECSMLLAAARKAAFSRSSASVRADGTGAGVGVECASAGMAALSLVQTQPGGGLLPQSSPFPLASPPASRAALRLLSPSLFSPSRSAAAIQHLSSPNLTVFEGVRTWANFIVVLMDARHPTLTHDAHLCSPDESPPAPSSMDPVARRLDGKFASPEAVERPSSTAPLPSDRRPLVVKMRRVAVSDSNVGQAVQTDAVRFSEPTDSGYVVAASIGPFTGKETDKWCATFAKVWWRLLIKQCDRRQCLADCTRASVEKKSLSEEGGMETVSYDAAAAGCVSGCIVGAGSSADLCPKCERFFVCPQRGRAGLCEFAAVKTGKSLWAKFKEDAWAAQLPVQLEGGGEAAKLRSDFFLAYEGLQGVTSAPHAFCNHWKWLEAPRWQFEGDPTLLLTAEVYRERSKAGTGAGTTSS